MKMRAMSTKQPVFIMRLRCERCGSDFLKVDLMNIGTSPGIDHVDFYCGICKKFITHFNASPYEVKKDVEAED
jgi:hypothetical protein